MCGLNIADAAAAFSAAPNLNTKLATGKALIGAIPVGSMLTLDPDLDSFYAMDARNRGYLPWAAKNKPPDCY